MGTRLLCLSWPPLVKATLEAVDKLKGIATPRGGLIDVLEILACRVLSSDILKAHAENPRLSGLAAIKEIDSRLRTRPNDKTVVKALLQWLKEQPEKRHGTAFDFGPIKGATVSAVRSQESLETYPLISHRRGNPVALLLLWLSLAMASSLVCLLVSWSPFRLSSFWFPASCHVWSALLNIVVHADIESPF
ncbi:putative transmembrane protein [Toxoplasma gondii TgCatPRC2]|uniref:Putative transmembrane protein n=1 Tax=Toxoplasma gondii TgCatPRC2 TaxID=1130821 RepID=A0A151HHH4_TOXGO|nr:putative transmembrane protein [Toxoplasma gondii TgCatPRC2]